MVSEIIKLIFSFITIGLFGFGGGYAIIPLVEKDAVNKLGWLSLEHFTDGVAFANILPGPVAPKVAVFVGYEVLGIIGGCIALIALILPGVINILIFNKYYYKIKNKRFVRGIKKGVMPVVVILLFSVIIKMSLVAFPITQDELISKFGILTILIGISTIILMKLKIHPAFIILGAMIYGAIFMG